MKRCVKIRIGKTRLERGGWEWEREPGRVLLPWSAFRRFLLLRPPRSCTVSYKRDKFRTFLIKSCCKWDFDPFYPHFIKNCSEFVPAIWHCAELWSTNPTEGGGLWSLFPLSPFHDLLCVANQRHAATDRGSTKVDGYWLLLTHYVWHICQ